MLAALTLGGGLLRLARITRPDGLVFDEIFYAQDACVIVLGSSGACGGAPQVGAHPPLGEILIASGIAVFGYEAFGWRVASLVAGILTIALLYLMGRRLFGTTLGASIAAGLLAFDFLHFVHSRIAMLDVFLALFATAVLTFAVLDRDVIADRARATGIFRGRHWRYAAGIAGGAAAACKWSGALALFAAIALIVAWEIAARVRDGRGNALWRAVREAAPATFLALGVVPLIVYFGSYLGTMPGDLLAPPLAVGSWFRNVVDQQLVMAGFHVTIPGHHPYESPGWSWLLLKQPVAYYFDTFRGDYQEILALGNPLVWWSSVPATAYVVYRWLRSRSLQGAEPVIVVGIIATLAPWFFVTGVRNAVFLFYILPTVPLLCLAVAYVLTTIAARATAGRIAVAAYLAACLAAFAFYYPVLAAVPTAPDAWRTRILFNDCAIGADFRELPDDESSQGDPPEGWCWR